jgi:hypothetical protein
MNSRNHSNHDPFDAFIGRNLKNWLERCHPPADAREKLLNTASTDSHEILPRFQFWQTFLKQLTFRITSPLALNQGQTQYSLLSQNSFTLNANFHTWNTYQSIIRSYPAGRGLPSFVY